MERRAPVSRVWRARERRSGGVVGVGRRAFNWRRCFLALVRREAILWGGGGGVDCRAERVDWRSAVDIVGGLGEVREVIESGSEALMELDVAVDAERTEKSALRIGHTTARIRAKDTCHDIVQGPGLLWTLVASDS